MCLYIPVLLTSKYVLCPVDVDIVDTHICCRIVDRRVFELRKNCVRIFWIGNGRGIGYRIFHISNIFVELYLCICVTCIVLGVDY